MPFLSTPSSIVVTVLGSGTSQGVPMIGCECPVCQSTDPRDRRTRCSIYVQTPEGALLVDTTPDLHAQALREGVRQVDAVFFTHSHSDHIMGFDDLRRFCELRGGPMPIYGSAETLGQVQRIFYYAFNPTVLIPGYVHAVPHVMNEPLSFGGLEIVPLPVPHGNLINTAYGFRRHGKMFLTYLTDCSAIPEAVRPLIQGTDVLIIDGVRDKPHSTHFTVSQAIEAAAQIEAKQTYITHLAHEKSHRQRLAEMPLGVTLAYDGLKLEFPW